CGIDERPMLAAIDSQWPELEIVHIRRRFKAHPTNFAGHLRNPFCSLRCQRPGRHAWERRHEISERVILRNPDLPLEQLTLEHEDAVPGLIESEISGQADEAITNRLARA